MIQASNAECHVALVNAPNATVGRIWKIKTISKQVVMPNLVISKDIRKKIRQIGPFHPTIIFSIFLVHKCLRFNRLNNLLINIIESGDLGFLLTNSTPNIMDKYQPQHH